MNEDPDQISEAIVAWTGWRSTTWPAREAARLVRVFGEETALALMPAIRQLEDEFYESDASRSVPDLADMGEAAAERFRRAHPEISEEAIRALAWCYTFDFK